VDSIVIDNPKSKLDFGFGLSIQFCHFNPNPKYHNYFIKKLKFHSASFLGFRGFIIKLGHLLFAALYLIPKIVELC